MSESKLWGWAMYVIGFMPPLVGLEGDFNTIRIGGKWSKTLHVGDEVALMDEKSKFIVGNAVVTDIDSGKLIEVLDKHWMNNHTGLNRAELEQHIKKIYGPHIAGDTKLTSVVYLRRSK